MPGWRRCDPLPQKSQLPRKRGRHVEETIEFVASLPANDRIKVVQETYELALIMAEGYNHELLKSEAEMLEEIQQAIGEALPYGRGSVASNIEEHVARPAA